MKALHAGEKGDRREIEDGQQGVAASSGLLNLGQERATPWAENAVPTPGSDQQEKSQTA
jgi:hypothetical protein